VEAELLRKPDGLRIAGLKYARILRHEECLRHLYICHCIYAIRVFYKTSALSRMTGVGFRRLLAEQFGGDWQQRGCFRKPGGAGKARCTYRGFAP
ncbi:MAG TPA: hypothetical protein VGE84_04135, partial [Allosphingosinicella sp.]